MFEKSLKQSILNIEKSPFEIADTQHTKKKLCIDYTRNRLLEKIRCHLQGARQKKYDGGMNMTMEEFTTLLDAWPRRSDTRDPNNALGGGSDVHRTHICKPR